MGQWWGFTTYQGPTKEKSSVSKDKALMKAIIWNIRSVKVTKGLSEDSNVTQVSKVFFYSLIGAFST